MAKRTRVKFGALLAAMMMSLMLLPATALGAASGGQVIYVGGQNVTGGGYWTTDDSGIVTKHSGTEIPSGNYIHYDKANNTLTLHNATIKTMLSYDDDPPGSLIFGAAIGVLNQEGCAELAIKLEGDNTIEDVSSGIDVLSSVNGAASLTITGEDSGSLSASCSRNGIKVQSNSGDATLKISNAKVTAASDNDYRGGVEVQAGQKGSASLTVDGGSLIATGGGTSGAGIYFYFGGGAAVDGTSSLSVRENALVDAREGGIQAGYGDSAQDVTPTGDSTGIVFDGNQGTVYGEVTLQEDLAIGEGESLVIPSGASLAIPEGATLTNEGTVTTTGGGTLTNNGTINNSGTLPIDIEGTAPPSITATHLAGGTVGTAYSAALAAYGSPASWAITDGSLPGGLTLAAETGVISGIPTMDGSSTFTVMATNGGGSDSEQLSIVISPAAPSITVQPSSMTVTAGNPADFTVTATGSNLTYLWQQCADGSTWTDIPDATGSSLTIQAVTTDMDGNRYRCVVTGDGGSVTSDVATLTVTAATVPVTGVTLSQTQARLYYNGVPNTISLAATVAPGNATNKAVTWTSSNPAVATVDGSGNVTAVAPGTATISVTTEDGAKTAACRVIVTGVYVPPRPAGPDWDDVADDVASARLGSTVRVDMDGKTVLPAEMLEALAGRDVTLALDMGDGVLWEIRGADVPAGEGYGDVDLGVVLGGGDIPADVANLVTGESGSVQVSLEHDGPFGFALTLVAPLGEDAAGLVANLYRFDEGTGSLGYEASARVDGEGVARLPFDHASSWLVALDARSHTLPFADAPEGEWYSEAIRWAWLGGAMTGYEGTDLFGTGDPLTRAQLAQVLYNRAGAPEVEPADGFADVDAADWFAPAVAWASSEGLITGYGEGAFGPDDALTREQLAVVFWRMAGEPAAEADLSGFPDGAETSAWAVEAMEWAVSTGLLGGYTDTGRLDPTGDLTRAQAATVFFRLAEEE